ncbi:PIN-like domain-containing protein [Leifsonia sp. Le1]|uniref:PIN-like domain-containing protein n=1 Tax=Leifsonia sp. Le1 TaxID=3404918 RepID=UPI003EB98DF4
MGMNLTDGFDQFFRPDPERVKAAFSSGLIVLDTNVLLNIFRYSPSAREELLTVIESISSQCFVPHQVAAEFNAGRVGVVVDRRKELNEVSTAIDKVRTTTRTLLKRMRERRMVAAQETQQLEDSLTEFIERLRSAADDALKQYDLDPAKLVGNLDPWTIRLNDALRGKVAPRPSDDLLKADTAEAARRREQEIAPGFRDTEGGDYLWWAEVMRCPEIKSKPLLVVSDDFAKGDWWYEQHGISIGPQSALIDDVLKAGGSEIFLLTTHKLLELAEDVRAIQVSDATLAESQKALTSRAAEWTLAAYAELIYALEDEGYLMQAKVLRAAAANGGHLERDSVYEIAGLSEADRSLRQFATPVLRLTRILEDRGAVPQDLPEALTAVYEGPGRAVAYSVPTAFVEYEQILLSAEEVIEQEATTDWSVRTQARAQMRSGIKRLVHVHGAADDAVRVAELLLTHAQLRTGEDFSREQESNR